MKRILAGLALALSIAVPAVAAPSAIAIDPASDLTYHGFVRFDVTVEKLKGYEYPLVLVACSGDPIGLYHPDETVYFDGRPGSVDIGGPADCTAQLWAYVGLRRGKYERPLTGVIDFRIEA